jgi:thiol-disulfide isomerase/thioredoxin
MQQQVRALPNVAIQFYKEIKEIKGTGNWVNQISVFDNKIGATESVNIHGVFLAIGHEPRTALVAGKVKLRKDGSIFVKGRSQQTSVSGIFAAGDVEDMVYRQAGIAAGEGMKAAIEASGFLQRCGFNPIQADKLHDRMYIPERIITDKPAPIKLLSSVADFDRVVLKAYQPVIIDFYAPSCPSCMYMMPIYELVSRQFADKILFCKVDTSQALALAGKLKIERIPCFIVFKNGEQVARYHSIMSKPEMIAFVQQFIAG